MYKEDWEEDFEEREEESYMVSEQPTFRRFIYMTDYTRYRKLKFFTFESIGMVYPFTPNDVPYIRNELENSENHECSMKNCKFKYVEAKI